jgi:hypothetical protein
MAQPLIETDRASAPRFLTLDRRVPEAIRQLLDEADGCANMSFAVGGSSCVRMAIRKAFELESVDGDDFHAAIVALGENTRPLRLRCFRSSSGSGPATNRSRATRSRR